jgi:uncharacterized protein YjeT (DUF2065 family)
MPQWTLSSSVIHNVSTLYVHAAISLLGLLAILEGVLLATSPRLFGFLAGPGGRRPEAHDWTRLQGAGFMLLGACFVLAALPPNGVSYEPPVLALAVAACVMFSLAVLRRGGGRAYAT